MLCEGEVFLGVEYMKSGVVLGEKEVSQIKGMLARGDRQMHIATYFGVNQARVNEVRNGKRNGAKYRHVPPAPADELPDRGPYVVVSRARMSEAEVKAAARDRIIADLELLLKSYRDQEPVSMH